MALAGTLRQMSLEDVLHLVDEERRAGLLLIKNGSLSAELHLDAGQILCVQRNGVGQTFSERLINAHLVTPQQLGYVRALYEEKPITTEVDLARALLQCNYLSSKDLRNWVADDAVELLVVLLSWDDGTFQFEEGLRPPPGRMVVPVPIAAVLDEALHHIAQRRHRVSAARVAVTLDLMLDFAEEVHPPTGEVQLTPDQWRLLTAIDGRTPLWALCKTLRLSQSGALRFASELLSAGVLVVSGFQRDASAPSTDEAEEPAPQGAATRSSLPRQPVPPGFSGPIARR